MSIATIQSVFHGKIELGKYNPQVARLRVTWLPSWILQVGYYEPETPPAYAINLTRVLDLTTCFVYESKVIFLGQNLLADFTT